MFYTIRTFRLIVLSSAACIAAPALADHSGPVGGITTGGGINTISARTLEQGQAAAGVRLSINRPDQLSETELLARDSAGVDAHNNRDAENAAIAIAYGLTHELTISAELSYVRRGNIRAVENDAVENRGTTSGVGDLTVLAKYKIAEGETWAVAVIGGLKLPTGSSQQLDRTGERFETEHQPGTGSWDPIAGIVASFNLGANAIDASWIYQKASSGAQVTRLGDRSQAGIAFSHRFGKNEAHHHGSDEDHHERHTTVDAIMELNGEWEGRERVGAVVDQFSGGLVLWLSPGIRFNAASGWSFAGSLGLPITQDIRPAHPDNSYRFSLSLGRSF